MILKKVPTLFILVVLLLSGCAGRQQELKPIVVIGTLEKSIIVSPGYVTLVVDGINYPVKDGRQFEEGREIYLVMKPDKIEEYYIIGYLEYI